MMKQIPKSKMRLLPAHVCTICERPLSAIGGCRITATYTRGSLLSDKYLGGGNPDFPKRSFPLRTGPKRYLVVWGSFWDDDAIIQRAIDTVENGKRPWFCQLCANRICHECGQPVQFIHGSDILKDNGYCPHAAILPISPGCCNPNCSKHRPKIK